LELQASEQSLRICALTDKCVNCADGVIGAHFGGESQVAAQLRPSLRQKLVAKIHQSVDLLLDRRGGGRF